MWDNGSKNIKSYKSFSFFPVHCEALKGEREREREKERKVDSKA